MASRNNNSLHPNPENFPVPMRLYALEGITATMDEAIVRQGVTIAEHDSKVNAHAVALAVQDNRISQHDRAIADLTGLVNKVIWALATFSLAISMSAIGVIVTNSL